MQRTTRNNLAARRAFQQRIFGTLTRVRGAGSLCLLLGLVACSADPGSTRAGDSGGTSAGTGGGTAGSAGSAGSAGKGVGGSAGSVGGSGGQGVGGSAVGGSAGSFGGTGGNGAGGSSGGLGGNGAGGSSGGLGGSSGAGGQGGSAGTTGGSGGSAGTIDPGCIDGQVFASEVMPTHADIKDLVDSYQSDQRQEFAIQALERRYPTGAFILAEANNKTNCFEIAFGNDVGTAEKIIAGLRTSVHECGHMIDLNQPQRFVIREDLQYKCDFSIATSGQPRNIILNDEFQARWPDDSFRKTYLEDLGTQTFDALLNEASQYVNTLATSFAFYDYTTFDPFARDGAHAFYWYVARFLRKARLEHSADYDKLVNDQCWRQLILTTWGRSYRYLVETKGMEGLGSQDDALLETLRAEPVLLEEIQRLRDLEGC